MLKLRNALVKFANKLVARSISTDWNNNGEMRFVRSFLEGVSGQPVLLDIGANLGRWAKDVLELNKELLV